MMRRHFISVMLGGGLMILLSLGGGGVPGFGAAKGDTLRQGVPAPPPAVPAGGAGGAAATFAPATTLSVAPTYRYSTAGKADPFRPFMETDPVLKQKMEEEQKRRAALRERSLSPLQQADIGQFRLVGIAGDRNRRVAVVEDRAGKKFYPLFVGTHIGLNGGRVAAILPDRLIVEEPAARGAKKAQTRRVTVMLHKEEEEKP